MEKKTSTGFVLGALFALILKRCIVIVPTFSHLLAAGSSRWVFGVQDHMTISSASTLLEEIEHAS